MHKLWHCSILLAGFTITFACVSYITNIPLVFTGWGSGDRRSKYKIDISGIVAEKIELPDGRHIAYVEQGVSKELAKHNILVLHGFLSSRLAGNHEAFEPLVFLTLLELR